jgi:hypothetical protein
MDSHEVLCTERWNQLRNTLTDLQKSVDGTKKKMDNSLGRLPVGVIATLSGVCGWLADRAFPFH